MRHTAIALLGTVLAWSGALPAGELADREAVIRALQQRSRLLEDVHFRIPIAVYRNYVRSQLGAPEPAHPAPVAWVAEGARYRLTLDANDTPVLAATLRLRVFQPRQARNVRALTAGLAWQQITVNGRPARPAVRKGWLCFTPGAAGPCVVAARVPLKRGDAYGHRLALDIVRTLRTSLRFDAPTNWDVTLRGAPMRLRGEKGKGTHGELAVPPRTKLEVAYARPVALPPRPARYQLDGEVAWNLDAGRQQVAARIGARILGGKTDRLVLRLPAAAARVSVTGPDVREAQPAPGAVAVFLRGRIAGRTRLDVSYELPLGAGGVQRFARPEIADAHWAGGTFVVTNTAGGSEVVAHSTSGLREMHPGDLPAAARAILSGKPVLAYAITSRRFEAAVDVINLGEFALRESIADLAHYQVLFRPDGSALCKVDYEIRNRTRQFLRLELPPGARVLLARVNDKPRPVTPVAGHADACLLPLVRSKASLKGLVSFPVQVLVLYRGGGLLREGEVPVPLPRIDLPIAYGWCELYVPEALDVRAWAGPLRRVDRYSSETAVVSLTYGRAELAEGYQLKDRPTVRAAPAAPPKEKPGPKGEPDAKPEPALEKPPPAAPTTRPARPTPRGEQLGGEQVLLARNYYRAGKDFYDRGQYDKAGESLQKVLTLFPKSPDSPNARRLLANIRMVQGDLAAASRQEKALGHQVKREISGLNVALVEQQQERLEQAREALRAGRAGEAQVQYEAAQSLGEQLVRQGADAGKQTVLLRETTEQLGKLQQRQRDQAVRLRERYKALKDKGSYGEALVVGQTLQRVAPGEKQVELRKELEALAVKTAQRRFGPSHRVVAGKSPAPLAPPPAPAPAPVQPEPVRLLDELARKGDKDERTRAHYQMAVTKYAAKDFTSAERHAQAVLALRPDHADARLLRRKIRVVMGKPPRREEGPVTWSGESARVVTGPAVPLQRPATVNLPGWDVLRPRAEPAPSEAQKEGTITGGGTISLAGVPTVRLWRRLPIRHADAGSVARVLQDVLDRSGAASRGRRLGGDRAGAYQLRADPSSGSLLVQADDATFQKLRALTRELDAPAGAAEDKGTIVERIERRRLVKKQPALVEVDKALQQSVEALDGAKKAADFMVAEQAARAARDALEANKHLLSAEEYRGKRSGVEKQLELIAARRDAFQKARAAMEARDIERLYRRGAPLAVRLARRLARIEELAREARMLREQWRFREALHNVERILARDRGNVWAAREKMDLAEQMDRLARQGLLARPQAIEDEEAAADLAEATDARRAESRWATLLRYPDGWKQLAESRRGIGITADDGVDADAALRDKLDRRIERLEFQDIDLADVIQFFREYSEVSIHPQWAALRRAGVSRNTPISIHSRKITCRDALEQVLAQAGRKASDQIVPVFADGVLEITTRLGLASERQRRRSAPGDLDGDGLAPGLRGKLERQIERLSFEDIDLADVLQFLREYSEVPIRADWRALEAVGVSRRRKISVDVRKISVRQALELLLRQINAAIPQAELVAAVADGQVVITTARQAGAVRAGARTARGVTKTYDVRDLLGAAVDGKEKPRTRDKAAKDLLKNVRVTLSDSLDVNGTVSFVNGRLVVRASEGGQKRAEGLITKLRELRGPQVELGGNIAKQRATGLVKDGGFLRGVQVDFDSDFSPTVVAGREGERRDARRRSLAARPEFQDFFARNYGWQYAPARARTPGVPVLGTIPLIGRLTASQKGVEDAAGRLVTNLEQKVGVNSTNIDLSAEAANQLGIRFAAGANDLNYAVVDEAQLRTLRELEAKRRRGAPGVPPNAYFQETIVGTDALLASGQRANVSFGGERGNTLDIADNTIALPHEKYVLLDNDGYLTAVRTGEMQHWTEPARRIEFAEVPQEIDVPRVGRLVKLEKTLIKPNDPLTIRATYSWEGAER